MTRTVNVVSTVIPPSSSSSSSSGGGTGGGRTRDVCGALGDRSGDLYDGTCDIPSTSTQTPVIPTIPEEETIEENIPSQEEENGEENE